MTQYHAKGRGLLGRSVMALLATSAGLAAANAIGAGGAQQYCNPGFLKGNGLMASMGVNGMGGAGSEMNINSPTLCVKQGQQLGSILDSAGGQVNALLKRTTNINAIRSLMNLQESDCKKQRVSPKSQSCFVFGRINRQAKRPNHVVSRLKNALIVSRYDKPVMMIIVEKFGSMTPKKQRAKPISQLFKAETSNTVFNEFDDVIHKDPRKVRHVPDKCEACLNSLKANVAGDVECECENNISINLNDFKGE